MAGSRLGILSQMGLRGWWRQEPHGPKGIRRLGAREYVGGLWEEIGKLQFEFMVRAGLQPSHYLLDVGCGCLRGGVWFVRYLDAERYLGVDKEAELIRAGVRELGEGLMAEKRPQLVVSSSFEFEKLGVETPDFALAQSLFTHLPPPAIEDCFRKLRARVFYATFSGSEDVTGWRNPRRGHDRKLFRYSRQEMERFGSAAGWRATYVGEWGHPRGQVMVQYERDASIRT